MCKKIIISFLLLFTFSTSFSVYELRAASNSNETIIYNEESIDVEKEILAQLKYLYPHIERFELEDISYSGPSFRYTTIDLGKEIRVIDLGEAANQNPEGMIISTGGQMYWESGNGYTTTFTVTVGWKNISLSLESGRRAEGVTGASITCKPNMPCKIGVKKKVRISKYKVKGFVNGSVELDDYVAHQQVLQTHLYNTME